MIEYSQPNTHKAFHVGHMRNVALGDCLIRLYEHVGFKVIAANYFGDEGAHVAKCLWLLDKKMKKENFNLDEDQSINPKSPIPYLNKGEWLGEIYSEASLMLDINNYTKYPYIGVIIGKIIHKEKHNNKDAPQNWNIVKILYDSQHNKEAIVVCGGDNNYNINDYVPYIPVGEKYKNKIIEPKDMKGVISYGMIMSIDELGIKLPKEEEEKDEINEKQNQNKKKLKKEDNRIYILNKYHNKKILKEMIGKNIIEIGKKIR